MTSPTGWVCVSGKGGSVVGEAVGVPHLARRPVLLDALTVIDY